jgi:hypothetical protein
MTARASVSTMRFGDPFVPKMMFYGSVVPDSVMSLRTLKEGSKLLLARLFKFAGDKDYCNPALTTLATELGTSEDKVGKWMKELEAKGFVRTDRQARQTAIRRLLWHQDLESSSRREALSGNHHETADSRNHTSGETAESRNQDADESAKTSSMNPQNGGAPIRKKRIIEENHHLSADSSQRADRGSKLGADDDDPISLKVKTLLTEFFTSRDLRLPRGPAPATEMAKALRQGGRDISEGTAEFLLSYGKNLRDAPMTWQHVLTSFETWIAKKAGHVIDIRKGAKSERKTTPSRYPLAHLVDPFENLQEAHAV